MNSPIRVLIGSTAFSAGAARWRSPLRLTALALLTLAAQAIAAAPAKPNVLLICVDDLKPNLACYGDTFAKTPNIDRLARSGVVFESAYCNQAVCAPSRNALMTGMRSTSLGVYDLPTHFRVAAPDAVTVAQLFRKNGYRTEALGKIMHVGHGNREDAPSWTVPHWRPRVGNYVGSGGGNAGVTADRGAAFESPDVADDVYADGKIAEEAIRRLQAAKTKPDEPFFLGVGFLKPHLPFCAPKKYWDLYDRAKVPMPTTSAPPAGAPAYAATTWGELRNYTDMPKVGPLTDAQTRELIHGYYAATSYMDAQLGRVLDELDRSGFASNTIVILWGDHGWHLGDHGQWCKHTNYEHAARIPLVMRVPGVTPAGSRTRALVETVDLFPTLAELATLPLSGVTQKLDGRSFVATLRNPAAPTKPAVFHAYPRGRPGEGPVIGRAVRTDRYRLVEWKKPGAPADTADLELYDYAADPQETRNLAAEQPQVVAQLRKILLAEPEAKPQVKDPTTPASPKKKSKK